MQNKPGATSAEWQHFIDLGLTADLLPVVSDPDATISPRSNMKAVGKTPSVFNRDGFVVGFPRWTEHSSSPEDIAKWQAEERYGICLQTRSVRAIDIDVDDTFKASRIAVFIEMFFEQNMPSRFRVNSGRVVLAFRLLEPMPKRTLKVDGGIIEFLGDGQQFIVAGQHPSGARYQWCFDSTIEKFPILTASRFEDLCFMLEEEFGIDPDGWSSNKRRKLGAMTDGQHIAEDDTLLKLEAGGYVLGFGSEGQAHIDCPFIAEHTSDNIVSSTSYFPAGTGGYERGHFVCLHAHCQGRADVEFLDALGLRLADFDVVEPDPDEPEEKPRRILNPAAHTEIAELLVADDFTTSGLPTLVRSSGLWFEHRHTAYVEREDEGVRGAVRRYLDRSLRWYKAKKKTEEDIVGPFMPTMAGITAVHDALKTVTNAEGVQSPGWLPGHDGPDPGDLLSLTNGLLHISKRALLAHTPGFFTLNTLPYAWTDDDSSPDQWLAFLEQVFPGDPESVATLQEMFGYLLTADTTYQKMFLLIGPPRSGKGTITRVLKALLGRTNTCGPTFSTLANQFGLESLVGKLAAIVPDARIGKINAQVVVERLLMVSGEDDILVERKGTTDWSGKLSCRFVVLTNEIPRLGDSSGALASRFITLSMKQSFLGREDLTLTARLLTELPAILRWALAGLDRLHARGRFIQPQAGLAAHESLKNANSPIGEFIDEKCDLGPGKRILIDDLYEEYRVWCYAQGRDHPGTKTSFGNAMHSALPEIQRLRETSGERAYFYKGIALRGIDDDFFDLV